MSKDGKKVLIIDAGGRGAVLVDKYAQSKLVDKIYVVPGNPLMQINTKKPVSIYPELKTTSLKEIIQLCKKEKIDLVDVAQDSAIEAGLVDRLQKEYFAVIGPVKSAGQIEWDKVWARNFMTKYGLPIPKYFPFKSQVEAVKFLKKHSDQPWFVKVSGLAEGKGAIAAQNNKNAIEVVKNLDYFGKAAETFLLEEKLEGDEFSAFALSDGEKFQFLGAAQDYKRQRTFDEGPNTGGMGCVANPHIITPHVLKQINEIFEKTFEGMKNEGRIYQGILYLGGMLVKEKVFVIEFNARWGDPEAQVILPSIKNDWYQVAMAVSQSELSKVKIKTDQKCRLSLTCAAKGYPQDYSKVKGKKIYGLRDVLDVKGVKIYGAGVKADETGLVISGGRIMHICAEGKNILQSRQRAYQAIALLSSEGDNLYYRTDIGWRELEKMRMGKRRS